MTTLLERAKAVEVRKGARKKVAPQRVELALAWMRGEVTITAAQKSMKLRATTDAYVPIATALREAYRQGLISLKQRKV